MPPDTRARSKPTAQSGEALEARVAQVWFWEGAFVRRAVNLQRHFSPDPLLVTDIDILAIEIDSTLGFRRTIGEAKSGTSKNAPKPLDRVIWLRGLMEVMGAQAAELTSELVPSNRVRKLGHTLGVSAQSTADLERREVNLRLADIDDLATFGVKWIGEIAEIRKTCSLEPDLERAFWFLRSEVWFLEPFSALKRTLTTIRFLAERWTPGAPDDHEYAVRWLLTEATVVAALNAVGIAGFAVRLGGDDLIEVIEERLAEGSIPIHSMRAIAKSFDTYLTGVLRELKAPQSAIVRAVGAFEPQAPDYAPAVVELARRLSAGSSHSRLLPRWADLMCFERVVREREPTELALARLGCTDIPKVAHAARLVASFLRVQAGLPEQFVVALGSTPRTSQMESVQGVELPVGLDGAIETAGQLQLPGSGRTRK